MSYLWRSGFCILPCNFMTANVFPIYPNLHSVIPACPETSFAFQMLFRRIPDAPTSADCGNDKLD